MDATEYPAAAVGISDRRVGIGHGSDKFEAGPVLLAEVLVERHRQWYRGAWHVD